MNYLKKAASALVVAGFMCIAWVGVATAHSFHTGTSVTLSNSEQIHQSVFAAGKSIDINNEIFGDVFCAGQTVHVSGTIHGDVLCAGQTLVISGKIDGDVRIAGQDVVLNADVTGNATVGGQNFTLSSEGKVGGDMTVGSSDAVFHGSIGRDLALGGQSAVISNVVGRDIKGYIEDLTLSTNANVGGTIEYTSNKELKKETGAQIAGKVTKHTPKQGAAKPKRGAILGFGIAWYVYWLAAILVIAMTFALLFPHMLNVVTKKGMPWPWKALLVGLLAQAVFPLTFVLLMITVIGIPLALILLVLWIGVGALSIPVFAYYVGRKVMQNTKQTLLVMLVGTAIVVTLLFIPFIGFIVSLISLFVGSGMIFLEVLQRTPKPDYQIKSGVKK